MVNMDIYAKITGIKYTPSLCRELTSYNFTDIENALSNSAAFILNVDKANSVAVSWWVSAKRTRSYPYARVYDTLGFAGKKITIIPVVKDEGKEGDRDFLQWDTISLMSLLGIYVIIAFYSYAEPSRHYPQKITTQRFDIDLVKKQIKGILSYQSDALHWNLSQIDKVGDIGLKALAAYKKISNKLKIEMHSSKTAEMKIKQLLKGKEEFMSHSRKLAAKAQKRESVTIQPKERLSGIKGTITIKNYLGGHYYFTVDEISIDNKNVFLIESKHTRTEKLPSEGDIKDGLLKMILFTNLQEVKIDKSEYLPVAILKLTTKLKFSKNILRNSQIEMLNNLKREAKINGFQILINNMNLQRIEL
jgi:hypothetical protein